MLRQLLVLDPTITAATATVLSETAHKTSRLLLWLPTPTFRRPPLRLEQESRAGCYKASTSRLSRYLRVQRQAAHRPIYPIYHRRNNAIMLRRGSAVMLIAVLSVSAAMADPLQPSCQSMLTAIKTLDFLSTFTEAVQKAGLSKAFSGEGLSQKSVVFVPTDGVSLTSLVTLPVQTLC